MMEPEDTPVAPALGAMRGQWRPAMVGVAVLTALTGVVSPLVLAVPARVLFPHQAGGSLIVDDGVVVGSALIGQEFTGPGYFHPRPSAAGAGYDASTSGGTNLGPANPKLVEGSAKESFAGVRGLAESYRRENGLAADAKVPVDAVTRSGSGLDPHISPGNAAYQLPRVAQARGLSEDAVRRLVTEHTRGRQFGLLGAPRVDVLALNLALDRAFPRGVVR